LWRRGGWAGKAGEGGGDQNDSAQSVISFNQSAHGLAGRQPSFYSI